MVLAGVANLCYICRMIRCIAALILCGCWCPLLFGQVCPVATPDGPPDASESRTLQGTLIYHDGLRQWFELKLDKPECGQSSIELFPGRQSLAPLEVLRGCRVESRGGLGFAVSGYYTLDENQSVESIDTVGPCTRHKPFPDYSKERPAKDIRSYRVVMRIRYGSKHRGWQDSSVRFRVTSAGKELQPWQAYASYILTGGYVLYGHCGEGFVVNTVFGTPQANPSHFEEARTPEDMAEYDPEGPAAAGIHYLRLGYTCIRKK